MSLKQQPQTCMGDVANAMATEPFFDLLHIVELILIHLKELFAQSTHCSHEIFILDRRESVPIPFETVETVV